MDCFFYICRPDWDQYFREAAMQVGIRAVPVRSDSIDTISVYSCVFVDLSLAIQTPSLLSWTENAISTTNDSLYVVPFFTGERPAKELFAALPPQLSAIQSQTWSEIDVVDRIVSSLWRGRRYVVHNKYRDLASHLFTAIDLPLNALARYGLSVIPSAYLAFHWFLPVQVDFCLAIMMLSSFGGSISRAIVQRRETQLLRYTAKRIGMICGVVVATAAFFVAGSSIGYSTALCPILASWFVCATVGFIGSSINRFAFCTAICDLQMDQATRKQSLKDDCTVLLPMENESPAEYMVRKYTESSFAGRFVHCANENDWLNVFISHRNHEPGIGISERIHKRLLSRGRMVPFLDRVHLQEGSYRREIGEALDRCGVFIAILTNPQDKSWLRRELECAIHNRILYGSPEIHIVEGEYALQDLGLDEQLVKIVNLDSFPRYDVKSPDCENALVLSVESSIYRNYPASLGVWTERIATLLNIPIFLLFASSIVYGGMCLIGVTSGSLAKPFLLLGIFGFAAQCSGASKWLYVATHHPHLETRSNQVLRQVIFMMYPVLLSVVGGACAWIGSQFGEAIVALNLLFGGLVYNVYSPFFLDSKWQDRRYFHKCNAFSLKILQDGDDLVLLCGSDCARELCRLSNVLNRRCRRLDSVVNFRFGSTVVIQREVVVLGSYEAWLLAALSKIPHQERALRILVFGTSACRDWPHQLLNDRPYRDLGQVEVAALFDRVKTELT